MAEIERITHNIKIKIEMKNFIHFFKENFKHLGMNSNQSHINTKSTTVIFVKILYITMCIAFLFFEANIFLEYVVNIFLTTIVIGCCISYVVVLFKKDKLFKFMENCTEFFNESE